MELSQPMLTGGVKLHTQRIQRRGVRLRFTFRARHEVHSLPLWLCREFLASTVAGVLEIHVEGAKDLRAGDVRPRLS